MRATISFDIELDKVEETMSALVSQQSSTLRVTANILDNAGNTTLLDRDWETNCCSHIRVLLYRIIQ